MTVETLDLHDATYKTADQYCVALVHMIACDSRFNLKMFVACLVVFAKASGAMVE